MKKTILSIACLLSLATIKAQTFSPCYTSILNSVGSSPYSIVTADFNNDGKADLANTNAGANFISVLLGTGTGTFGTVVSYTTGFVSQSIISADFNSDGNIDLATANMGSGNVSVLLGTGSGSFSTAINFNTGVSDPTGLASGDFNGDNIVDLAVTCYSGYLFIYYGTGVGTFTFKSAFVINSNPNNVLAIDVNADGKTDLVTANYGSNNINVYLGSGVAATPFVFSATYASASSPTSVKSADFNGDGNLDLIVCSVNSGWYTHLGTGTGTFAAGVYSPTSFPCYNVIPFDFNGDGKMDIISAIASSSNLWFRLGDGTGGFLPATGPQYSLGAGNPTETVFGYFNGDTKPDFAVVCQSGNKVSVLNSCMFTVQAAALSFDGINDKVSMSAAASLSNLAPAGFSMESWVYPRSGSGVNSIIRKSGDYNLYINGGKLSAEVWTLGTSNSSFKLFTTVSTLSLNAWSHVAFTWNGTTGILYVNGAVVASTISNNSVATSENLSLGASNVFGNYLNGALDEVRIWNIVRSQCEINTYMACEIPATASGLVANYHFNEPSTGTVTNLTDASGSVNTGTLTNFTFIGTTSNWITPGAIVSGYTTTVNLTPTVNSTVTNSVICNGASTTLNGTGASTYVWTGGVIDGTPFSPTSTVIYTVTGVATNGCTNTAVNTVSVNALPTISVNSGAICAGQSFTMVPTGAMTYTYSSGIDIVTPTADATYSVSGTDVNGCLSNVDAVSSITVNALPTISVNSGTICAGQTFTMIPTGAVTYNYSNGSDIVMPMINDSYTVTGTDVNGCENTSVSSVTVNALPIISVNSGAICAGQSFTMIPSGAVTYTYSNGTDVVMPTADDSFTVTGTDVNGCENTSVSSVTVNALPIISVNSEAICIGQSFTMIPSGAATYTYSSGTDVVMPTADATYTVSGTDINGCISSTDAIASVTVVALPTISVNSGVICAGQSFTIVPSGAMTYTYSSGTDVVMPTADATYSVSGTDANGCVSSTDAIASVTVNTLPTITVNSGVICAGQSFTMVPSGADTYTYSGGTDVVMPTADATYSVSGTDVNGCLSNVNAVSSVTVNALPSLMVMTTNTLLCIGETATLTAMGATSYTWSTTETTTDIAVTPTTQTTYTVDGTDGNGCSNTTTITRDVSVCTGITQLSSTSSVLNIYPNPNNGVFTIKSDMDVILNITNELGQVLHVIYLNDANNRQTTVDVLASGIYFVIGQNENQSVRQKIIVSK